MRNKYNQLIIIAFIALLFNFSWGLYSYNIKPSWVNLVQLFTAGFFAGSLTYIMILRKSQKEFKNRATQLFKEMEDHIKTLSEKTIMK